MTHLWIDDERDPPTPGWTIVRTSADAIAFLAQHDGHLEEISFDHDLGGDDTTRPVIHWLIAWGGWPAVVYIHTANPVARPWLAQMTDRYAPAGTVIKPLSARALARS